MALLGLKKKQAFGQVPMMGAAPEPMAMGAPVQGMGQLADITNMPAMAQQPVQEPAKRKPNWLGIVGDSLQILGGGQATYVPQMREQQQRAELLRQRALEAQQARETGWQDYVRKQEYERANPKDPQPTEFERILQASGLPKEQQVQLMQDYARNRANPLQGVPFTDDAGNSGLQFIRPGQTQPNAGLVPIGGVLPPKGGQTVPPSATFPYR